MTYLGGGQDEEGPFRRRFLVRDYYLNPQRYSKYRPYAVAAGFRVIDTPSLTAQGKSAADICLTIDVVDAISHRTRYEEFIICSADADFSPLMTKLRRHDRRTVMVASSASSVAYAAVCDAAVGAMDIVAAYAGPSRAATDQDSLARENASGGELDELEEREGPGGEVGSEDGQVQPGDTPDQPFRPATVAPLSGEELTAAADAVRVLVAGSDAPVPGGTASGAARRVVPRIKQARWGGFGTFAGFIAQCLPELSFQPNASGGVVFDPTREISAEAVTDGGPGDIRAEVARVTGAPALTGEQYAALFEALAAIARDGTVLSTLPVLVTIAAARWAPAMANGDVSAVVTDLIESGCDPRSAGLDGIGLADAYAEHLLHECAEAGMVLEVNDRIRVRQWIMGDTSETGEPVELS